VEKSRETRFETPPALLAQLNPQWQTNSKQQYNKRFHTSRRSTQHQLRSHPATPHSTNTHPATVSSFRPSLTKKNSPKTRPVLRGQFKSLYRYGTRADCGSFLEEWKWCLANNSLTPDQKRDAWIRRRAEWWARRRLGRSSEDVWEYRRCAQL
jgi:hypothetical protein